MEHMDEILNKLGKRIRDRRREMDLSRAQLAEQAGLSVGQIARIERGEHVPKFKTVMALEQVLKIPLLSLLSVYFEQEPENVPVEQAFRNLGWAVEQKLMGDEKQTVSRAINLLARQIDPKAGETDETK